MHDFTDFIIHNVKKLINQDVNSDFYSQLNTIEKYCKGSCENIFGKDRLDSNPEFVIDYDILTWMNTGVTDPLKNYKFDKKSKIKFSLTQEQFDVLEDKLNIFGHPTVVGKTGFCVCALVCLFVTLSERGEKLERLN